MLIKYKDGKQTVYMPEHRVVLITELENQKFRVTILENSGFHKSIVTDWVKLVTEIESTV